MVFAGFEPAFLFRDGFGVHNIAVILINDLLSKSFFRNRVSVRRNFYLRYIGLFLLFIL